MDGVTGVTEVVEAMHAAIAHLPSAIGRPAPSATAGIPGFVYRNIRGVARMVGSGIDRSLQAVAPVLGTGAASPKREAALAIANGVLGDHLEASGNPLAIRMQGRLRGVPLPLDAESIAERVPAAGGRLLVQVHGLCMNDLQWRRDAHDHGRALGEDLGLSVVHLHYNTGRHVSHNGGDFARLLESLVDAWPVPVRELTLLCHSMGGLVARSAMDHAGAGNLAWARLPLRVVFLGTPHHGAPLERAGSWADRLLGITPYSAPLVRLGKLRSAGIQDLRHGNLRGDAAAAKGDAMADVREPVPLPPHVEAYAIAVSTQAAPPSGRALPVRGDGLVPVASALGRHPRRALDLRIPRSRQWTGYGLNHWEMLGCPRVYGQLLGWLESPMPAPPGDGPRAPTPSRKRPRT